MAARITTTEMGPAGSDGLTAHPAAPTLRVLLLPQQGTGHVPIAEMDTWKQKASLPQHGAHKVSVRPVKETTATAVSDKTLLAWAVNSPAAVLACWDSSVPSLMLFSWTSSDSFRVHRET